VAFRLAAPAVNYVLLEIADFEKWLEVLRGSITFHKRRDREPSIWIPHWEGGFDPDLVLPPEEREALLGDLRQRTKREMAKLAVSLRQARDRLSRIITSTGTEVVPDDEAVDVSNSAEVD
jgi:hypothetical protein